MKITPKFNQSKYRVIDARMGAGKSTAIINYINSTSHLVVILVERQSEVDRYVAECTRLVSVADMAELSGTLKSEEIEELVKQGKSIVSTHQLFLKWSGSLLREFRLKGYELIMDETVEGFRTLKQFSSEDFQLMLERKQLETVPDDELDRVRLGLFPLPSRYEDVADALKYRDCYLYRYDGGVRLITAPKEESFSVFDKVTILTYMFRGSTLRYMFELNGYDFGYFTVDNGDIVDYVYQDGQPYQHRLTVEAPRKNALRLPSGGARKSVRGRPLSRDASLSKTEAVRSPSAREVVRKLIRNTFRRWEREYGITSEDFAYTYHGDYWEDVHHRDHSNLTLNREYMDIARRRQMSLEQLKEVTFISQTIRGTNDFSHKRFMVFAVNVHMETCVEDFLEYHFGSIDKDCYALSRLVQWLWRGCIRTKDSDGEPMAMTCCVFSKRMRNLLKEWLGVPTE